MHVTNTPRPLPLIDLIRLSVIKGQRHRSTLPPSIAGGVLGTSIQAKPELTALILNRISVSYSIIPSQYDTADVEVLLKVFYYRLNNKGWGKRGTQLKKDSLKAMSMGVSRKSHSESWTN